MKKKILVMLGIVVTLNYSCQKDKLYPVNQTQVSNQANAPFTTPTRILSQVLALYSTARSGQFLGGRYQVYNEVKADNWVNYSQNSITAYQTWNETVTSTSSEVQNLWSQAYYVINNCNLFIDGMAAKGTSVVGNATAANYIGEAKFMRALSYYCLLQLYARPYIDGSGSKPGLPLRLTGNAVYGNYDLARSTVAQVYAQIISDLNDAETGLPASYSDALTNVIRAHKNTAIALKTRVYLSMQKYDNVVTEGNKIVTATAPFTAPTGVANALQADVTKVYASPYSTTESVFSMPFVSGTENPGTQNQLGYYFYQNAGTKGIAEFYLNPTGVIADTKWKSTDKRRSLLYTSVASATAGRVYTLKYPLASPYPDYAPVIRYPEVLLNLAEARARTTNAIDAQAVALLNAVRNRSDASTTYTVASFTSATDLINAILQERNIEFVGEGLRNIDLVRLGLTIPAKSTISAIPSTDSRYIWPIAGDELLYNKLMTPNN